MPSFSPWKKKVAARRRRNSLKKEKCLMFTDGRSKKVIFLAHCLLNQNAISDGTAVYPAAFRELIQLLLDREVGVVQMPCPELCCLGLDRGDVHGADRPVVEENTRIRRAMEKDGPRQKREAQGPPLPNLGRFS